MQNKFSLNKRFILFLFALIIGCLTSSCSSAITLKSGENGTLIDTKNEKTYIDCSISLRAKSISEDVYAKGSGNDKINLYEITGLDPSEWLSEDIRGGIPSVFREQNAIPVEPTIEDFDSKIVVTQTEVLTMQVGLVEEKDTVLAYINELLTSEEAILPSYDSFDYSYSLRFESEKYPGLQYLVQYYVDNSGKAYLYDRGTKKSVISNIKLLK